MIRKDIIAAYRKHLELTGRAIKATPVEMTIDELKARIKAMDDSEILEIDLSFTDSVDEGSMLKFGGVYSGN